MYFNWNRLLISLEYRFTEFPLILVDRFLYKVLSKKKKMVIHAWADFYSNRIRKKKNYGDDLNVYLLRALSDNFVLNFISFKDDTEHLLAIGSIINMYSNKNAIVWGSGVMRPNEPLKEKPKKVLAVRGKLTREYLIKNGVECPEVYGDPALLLPLVYTPRVKKSISLV